MRIGYARFMLHVFQVATVIAAGFFLLSGRPSAMMLAITSFAMLAVGQLGAVLDTMQRASSVDPVEVGQEVLIRRLRARYAKGEIELEEFEESVGAILGSPELDRPLFAEPEMGTVRCFAEGDPMYGNAAARRVSGFTGPTGRTVLGDECGPLETGVYVAQLGRMYEVDENGDIPRPDPDTLRTPRRSS